MNTSRAWITAFLCLICTTTIAQQSREELIDGTRFALTQAFDRGKYDLAIELGHKLVELVPDETNPPYQLACAYALKGNADKAIEWLRKAAEQGYSFPSTLLRDGRLDSIRGHADFASVQSIVKRNSDAALEKFKRRAERATVLTFLPPEYDKTKPVPLLVALHGYGTNANDIASAWRRVAADAGVILIAPQAMDRAGRGFSWRVIEQSDYLVRRAIKQARAEHNIDPKRIVITGFSQGGSMTYHMGLRYPDQFAGAIPMAGHCDPRVTPIPETAGSDWPRFFIMVGGNDRPLENNRDAARRLEAAQIKVELRVYEGVGHHLPPNAQSELRDALRFVFDD